MNKAFLFVSLLFLVACSKQEVPKETVKDPVFDDPNWIQIKVPDAGQVYAVAGSIDDTLLVTTMTKAYFTANKGLTWQESKNFNGPAPGLLVVQDTIYALIGGNYDGKFEKSYASLSSYYTLNKGFSWNNSSYQNLYKSMQTGVAIAKDHSTFRLNYHAGPDKNGIGSNYILQTTITKTDNQGNTVAFAHPIKEQPTNLYIDKKDKLYVATGGKFTDSGVLLGASLYDPAYIYISKAPINN